MTSATRTPVPLMDLAAQYRPLREEILAAIARVCDSQRFIMGPEVEGLERELASSLEVREAIAVSSGTDALLRVLIGGVRSPEIRTMAERIVEAARTAIGAP